MEEGPWVSQEVINCLVWSGKRDGEDLHIHSALREEAPNVLLQQRIPRLVPGRVDISRCPNSVESRARFGDWEWDVVIGNGHRSSLVTLAEHRSRLVLADRTCGQTKTETGDPLHRITSRFEDILHSVTYDKGREF